jgi:hypothetical protein
VSEKRRALRASARTASAQIDRLLAGQSVEAESTVREVAIAGRLTQLVGQLPPVPDELERRVSALVRARQAAALSRRGRRWQPAVWSALATAAVLLLLWLMIPGASGVGGSVLAQMRAVLLGQTRVEVTPTLTPPSSRSVREPLRDPLAAELLIGRAPAQPKVLPEAHALQEVAALSYPDLPAWISQPLCVEFCYGPASAPCALRLRQYRLLFRDFGGISGVKVSSEAVRDVEQVEVQGVTAMRFTLASERGSEQLIQTIVWERDGLLLELESETLGARELLEIAQSTR